MRKIVLLIIMAVGTVCSFAQEAIDLGLSVLWSNMNLGATTPYEEGDYFAWAETKPKEDYTWETYFDVKTIKPSLTFKTFISRCEIEESIYDAARTKLGNNWRLPTVDDWQEMYEKCKISILRSEGVVQVTGPNGNSIIFPATGLYSGKTKKYPNYLEPTLWTSLGWGNSSALAIEFYSSTSGFTAYSIQKKDINMFCGLPIRPVKDFPKVIEEKKKKAYERELAKSSMELTYDAHTLFDKGMKLLKEGQDGTKYFKNADDKLNRVANKNEYNITALYVHCQIKGILGEDDEMKRIAELLVNEVNKAEVNDEKNLFYLLLGYGLIREYYHERDFAQYKVYTEKCREVAKKMDTINPSNQLEKQFLLE